MFGQVCEFVDVFGCLSVCIFVGLCDCVSVGLGFRASRFQGFRFVGFQVFTISGFQADGRTPCTSHPRNCRYIVVVLGGDSLHHRVRHNTIGIQGEYCCCVQLCVAICGCVWL